jgi:DNA-directed RNA polymerase subunit M/transcription elongation factor TFIIS
MRQRVDCNHCDKRFVPKPYDQKIGDHWERAFRCPKCKHRYPIARYTADAYEAMRKVSDMDPGPERDELLVRMQAGMSKITEAAS